MGIIRILAPATARLIAAGEVIDRPAAALRELLDNALDSGASEVDVSIEAGGIGQIRVVDDGTGMDREDLALSIQPHATSKIASADDLLRVRSLGFRGEALASIAAAARLEITTKDEASASAHRLVAGPGAPTRIEASPGRRGTAVLVSGLFDDFPARKQFLKRPQAEAALCRQTFTDKAIAHPGVRFKWSSGSAPPQVLVAVEQLERCTDCYPDMPRSLVYSIRFSGQMFAGQVVAAGPSYSRQDRRLLQVFVNRRRVQEWSLVQALEYSFSGFLPGGAHPCAFLFLEVDPSLADFNIHPAKREVRLKDPDSIRRSIVSAVQGFLSTLARRLPEAMVPDSSALLGFGPAGHWLGGTGPGSRAPGGSLPGDAGGMVSHNASGGDGHRPSWDDFADARERVEEARERLGPARAAPAPGDGAPGPGFRYVGRALGPFLLFERGDELFFLDQHAAHERLIFDGFEAKPPEVQELLVPLPFETEGPEEEARLAAFAALAAQTGFHVEGGEGGWYISALPALLRQDPVGALRELVRGISGGADAVRAARAMAACRAAVKDGDILDQAAAEELFARALELPEPRCPHGRPVWTRITREQLYRLVRRLV